MPLLQTINQSDEKSVAAHLRECDELFVPTLSSRVDVDTYARKLVARSVRFEAWDGEHLVGLLAAYVGDSPDSMSAYVTNVSVVRKWSGRGIGSALLVACVQHAQRAGCSKVTLEVERGNEKAISLYRRAGFAIDDRPDGGQTGMMLMTLHLDGRDGR